MKIEEHVGWCDAVVYTVAISPDNPESREALRRGLPVTTVTAARGA